MSVGTGNVAGQQYTGKIADDEMWRDRLNRALPIFRKLGMGDRWQYLTKEGYYEGPVSDAVNITDSGAGIAAEKFVYESGYNSTSGFREVTVADQDTVAETRNLLFVPTAIAADANGVGFKHYLLTGYDTSGWANVGDPVYLGNSGALTKTEPTSGNFTHEVGVILTDASSGVVSIDIAGENIPVHDHADNAGGGTISTAGSASTTNISFEAYYGTAEPSIGITGSSGGTGDFTQWISAAATVTSADATFLLPDTAGAGDTIVCKTIAETLANKTLTTPTISATGFTNAQHDHSGATSGGSIAASGSMTGTTSATWSLLPTADEGDLILSITGGGSNNSVTITNTQVDADIILTLPNATDQFVCRDTTDTLTNKTLTAPVINAGTLTGTLTISSTPTISGTWTDLGIVTTVDINGGTIDGTAIGGASTAAGAFTTLACTTLAASDHVTIAGGKDLILAKGSGEIAIAAATSGGITIKPTAISTSIVTLSTLAQTGAQTISIPDLTGGADTFATLALAQTFTAVNTFSGNCVFSGVPTFASITGNDASLGIAGLAAASSGAGGIVATAGGLGHTNGAGGAVTTVGGDGAGTGAGGLVSVIGGDSGAGATGNGGAASLIGGAAASTDGAGGAATVTGGAGNGAADGGILSLAGGIGGDGSTGAGGAASLTGGAADSTNGAGGAITVIGGIGIGTGDGGAVTVTGGEATTSTGDGGGVVIDGGATSGGSAGSVQIGSTTAYSTSLGRVAAITNITGLNLNLDSTNPMTLKIGAVDILQLDETDIATFAGATSTAGHALYMETEDGGTPASAEDGNAGGLLSIKCGDGSAGASTENQDGAAGGALTLTTGVGGAAGLSAAGTADGKAGGALTLAASNGGFGGIGTGGDGGAGGAVAVTTGTGGAATTPGAGGAFSVTTGAAGSTAAGTAGVSGAIALTTGTGGAATGAAASGASGGITLTTGDGGLSGTSANGGAAGTITLQGGTGGAEPSGGTGGAGGALVLAGGTAGNGAGTEGTGGAVTIDAGTGLANGSINIGTTNSLLTTIGIANAGGVQIQSAALVLDSEAAMVFQIGTVDILEIDDAAIDMTAAATAAGQPCYIGTEGGGTASGTAGQAGGLLSIVSGAGSVGTSTGVGGAGGALTLASGAGGATATGAGGVSGVVTIASGTGGATTAATAHASGAVNISSGTGGLANTSGIGGAGGLIYLHGGTGGAATGDKGGAGAAITLLGGTGGTSSGTNGDGGTVSIDAGDSSDTNGSVNIGTTNSAVTTIGIANAGIVQLQSAALILDSEAAMVFQIGTVDILEIDDAAIDMAAVAATAGQACYVGTEAGGTATTTGSAGGLLNITTGAGSDADTTQTAGAGGALALATGIGGNSTTGTAGASGAITIATGTAGATTTSGVGPVSGDVTISSGTGGIAKTAANGGAAGTVSLLGGTGGLDEGGANVGGVGGAVTLLGGTGGAGATGGVGGAVAINGGAVGAGGSPAVGAINIGTTNAGVITVGKAATAASATTLNGVVKGEAEGYMTHTLVVDVTAAEINTPGHVIVTVPANRQFQLVDLKQIAIGGAAAGATAITVAGSATIASTVVATLTEDTLVLLNTAGVTTLAAGASFTAQTAGTDISVNRTIAALTTATSIRFIISYNLL